MIQMAPLMTIEDLAARWDMPTTGAWAIVREKQVPYVSLGVKKTDLNGKGPRAIRFRPEAIIRWEEQQEGVWADPDVTPIDEAPEPAARPKTTAAERLGLNLPPRTGR